MNKADLGLFDIYKEPVLAVVEDGSIAYMNASAVSFFGGDRCGESAKELFSSTLLEYEGSTAVGEVTYGGADYTASKSVLGEYSVISVLAGVAEDAAAESGADNLLRNMAAQISGKLGTVNIALSLMRQQLERLDDEKALQYAAHLDREYHAVARELDHIGICLSGRELNRENAFYFDMAEVLARLVNTVSALMRSKSVRFRLNGAETPVRFYGDSRLVEQLVLNLISNSLKNADGDIEIIISLKKTAKGAIISVIDNGKGIKREDLGKVFRRYEQEPDISDAGTGIGMGLTVVRRIAAMYGGGVAIDSKEHGGTIVSVTLNSAETDREMALHTPTVRRETDMQLILTELADVLSYESYYPFFQD